MGLVIVLHSTDNVATAATPLKAGEEAEVRFAGAAAENGQVAKATVRVASDIRLGHKVALQPIPQGGTIIKYGEVIGESKAAIGIGEHAHVHNIEGLRGRGDLPAKEGK